VAASCRAQQTRVPQLRTEGKHGFKRPHDIRETVAEIDVQKLDEDAILYVAEDLAEETDDGYELDARDIVEDGHEVDVVKVSDRGRSATS